MYKILIFFVIGLFAFPSLNAQGYRFRKPQKAAEYQPRSFSEYSSILCQKKLDEDIRYAKYLLNNVLNDSIYGSITYAEFGSSMWLKTAASFTYNGVGYSLIATQNDNVYFFSYIPLSVLKEWENSLSPGNFYHTNIKKPYNLSFCYDYTP